VVPFPYAAQRNLGDLSDASEFRARIQVSFDVASDFAVDIGYDFTRWHATLRQLDHPQPRSRRGARWCSRSREYALAGGIRWKF